MDRELAAALAGELPVTAKVKIADARLASSNCSDAIRGATFNLPNGRISVFLVPPDVAMSTDSGSSGVQVDAPTSTGGSVVVVSVPAKPGGSVPYESDLSQFARNIARLY